MHMPFWNINAIREVSAEHIHNKNGINFAPYCKSPSTMEIFLKQDNIRVILFKWSRKKSETLFLTYKIPFKTYKIKNIKLPKNMLQ